ncbi:MAG: hypothetical protein QG629_889 [Patescibacteria group bacterium]|nr:hypothetical protein [Patescibacteria group bacterium]
MPLVHNLAQAVDITPLPNSGGGDPASNLRDVALVTVFGVLGAVSMLMIVIGGVRYILSQGNPEAMSKAKNTIMYALIGLVISLSAFGIISLIVKGVS